MRGEAMPVVQYLRDVAFLRVGRATEVFGHGEVVEGSVFLPG